MMVAVEINSKMISFPSKGDMNEGKSYGVEPPVTTWD